MRQTAIASIRPGERANCVRAILGTPRDATLGIASLLEITH